MPGCHNITVEIVKKWLPVSARPGLKELKAEWIKRDAKFAGHRAQTLRALALPGMLTEKQYAADTDQSAAPAS